MAKARRGKRLKVKPHVAANGAVDGGKPVDDFTAFIATVPGDRGKASYEVVRDLDSGEVHCECKEWATSPADPKLCRHIVDLVNTHVIGKREDRIVFNAVKALEQPAEPGPAPAAPARPSRGPLYDAAADMRKLKIAVALDYGLKSADPVEIMRKELVWAAGKKRYLGVLLGLRCDVATGGPTVLRFCTVPGMPAVAVHQLWNQVYMCLGSHGLHNVKSEQDASMEHTVITIWNEVVS